MRYMCFVQMGDDVGPTPPAVFEAMGQVMERAIAAGTVIDAGGLFPLGESTELRVADGAVTTTDGPYAETKEVVGGYAIIRTDTHAEAVAAAREVADVHVNHWPGWSGAVVIRPIAEPDVELPGT